MVGGAPNQMNVIVGIDFSITHDPTLYITQRYLADVGAYLGSPSYYGTFDQNGSLYQWNDLDGKPFPFSHTTQSKSYLRCSRFLWLLSHLLVPLQLACAYEPQ